jgi:aspartate/methionine/tyrosine aminotransferase
MIRAYPGTISLGQGVVSFGPPPEAVARLAEFPASADDNHYGPVEGDEDLVEAIEAKLEAENHVRPDASRRVVVTAGGNMAFMNAVLAVTDPGDEVILQAPYYFNHEMAVVMAGCRTVVVPTDKNYQLRPDVIRRAISSRTRAVVTISPNNPSGAVYPEEAIREVNTICAERSVFHIHDEAYEYFTYGSAGHFSPASIDGSAGHTVSLFSMSKAYGMAGWRIGYMVIPATLFEPVNKIQDTILICPARASQRLALEALRVGSGYCRSRLRDLEAVRNNVLAALQPLEEEGICSVARPDGAFYCLLRVRVSLDPLSLAERLIRSHGVAVVPGSAFGMKGCCLRVSYGALDARAIEEGTKRLAEGLRREAAGTRKVR